MFKWLRAYLHFFRFNLHGALMRKRLPFYAGQISGRVLDVGAGDIPYQRFFKPDEYIATNARGHYTDESVVAAKTDVWIDDATMLPFKNEEMNAVVCFQVLSVVQEPQRFFGEVTRVLKPGGKFLLTTDWLYPSWSPKDKARYSISELIGMTEAAGMNVRTIESLGGQRCLQYMLQSRWMINYPERIKAAKGMKKLQRIMQFLYYLPLIPYYSLKGCVAYALERNVKDSTGQTYGFLLFAEK